MNDKIFLVGNDDKITMVELSADEIELLKLSLAQFDKCCNLHPNEKELKTEKDMNALLKKLESLTQ